MDEGEKRVKQEDCSEDNLGAGILTLTNKRLAFDKTNSRIMDFSKRFGDTVLDIALSDITKTWKEGLFIKKICFTVNKDDIPQTYKFGVFSTRGWLNAIDDTMDANSSQ